MEINGKRYPFWGMLVKKKNEFIGGILEDNGARTTITDITLKPNGEDSAYFTVEGQGFSCGFDTGYGGTGKGESGWLTFYGYGGHKWRMKPPSTDR